MEGIIVSMTAVSGLGTEIVICVIQIAPGPANNPQPWHSQTVRPQIPFYSTDVYAALINIFL
jgi:hypothetical protein